MPPFLLPLITFLANSGFTAVQNAKARRYNSPTEQKRRLLEAGYSPNAFYKMGNTGNYDPMQVQGIDPQFAGQANLLAMQAEAAQAKADSDTQTAGKTAIEKQALEFITDSGLNLATEQIKSHVENTQTQTGFIAGAQTEQAQAAAASSQAQADFTSGIGTEKAEAEKDLAVSRSMTESMTREHLAEQIRKTIADIDYTKARTKREQYGLSMDVVKKKGLELDNDIKVIEQAYMRKQTDKVLAETAKLGIEMRLGELKTKELSLLLEKLDASTEGARWRKEAQEYIKEHPYDVPAVFNEWLNQMLDKVLDIIDTVL